MNVPEVVDVAIGLVVVFLLLATVGSVLVELVGQALRYREEILGVTVNRLLTGLDDAPWGKLRLLRYLLVNKVAAVVPEGRLKAFVEKIRSKETPLRSTGDPDVDRANRVIVDRFWNHAKIRSLAAPDSAAPAWLEPATFASVLVDLSVPRDSANELPKTRVALERRLGPGNVAVPVSLRQSLRTLGLSSTIPAGASGEALWDVFQKNIAGWFEEAMSSATARYRKFTQRWLLWIGFGTALILNADSIRIVHVLSHNEGLAEQVAAYAEMIQMSDTADSSEEVGAIAAARLTMAENMHQMQELERMGFPIGWQFEPESDFSPTVVTGGSGAGQLYAFPIPWEYPWAWFVKLLGLAITALAVSQGAPFWYDLLHKLVAVRRGETAVDAKAASVPGALPAGDGQESLASTPIGPHAPLDIGYDLARAAVGFDVRKAYWMAEAAMLAYAPASEIVRIARKEWFFCESQCWSMHSDQVERRTFAMADDEVVILSFGGTEPAVLRDLLSRPGAEQDSSAMEIGGEVRGACAEALTPVYPEILRWLTEKQVAGKMLYITGHGLGAAVATLFAARLLDPQETGTWRFQLYTFGSPPVGNCNFAAAFDRLTHGRVFRFVHGDDAVAHLPSRAREFSHVGELFHLTKNPEGLRREMSSLDRLLEFAGDGIGDLSQATREAIDDHSMVHYAIRLRKLAVTA